MIPSQLKPKYKALAFIKTDIWNTLKTKQLNKKKWRLLIARLKKNRYKKRPHLLSYHAKAVIKFPVYHRYKYQKNLIIRTKIKLLYGSLQDFKIKSLAKKATQAQVFAQSLEQKSTTFLYRLGLTSTYGEAKIHYIHKRLIVNGSYQQLTIKKGDVLHFSPLFEKLLKRRILLSFSKQKNFKLRQRKLVGLNTVDFDPSSFRFYFLDNLKYFKNHPFLIPFEKTWRYYTRV
jgi:hypothetical protein